MRRVIIRRNSVKDYFSREEFNNHTEIICVASNSDISDIADPSKIRGLCDKHSFYLVNSDAGEIAADIWKKYRLDKKLVVLSKSSKVTKAMREGLISSQIVQRNTLWGEMAAVFMNRMLMGEETEHLKDTGMYEINKANLPIFEIFE